MAIIPQEGTLIKAESSQSSHPKAFNRPLLKADFQSRFLRFIENSKEPSLNLRDTLMSYFYDKIIFF